jgi:hypothetical protein
MAFRISIVKLQFINNFVYMYNQSQAEIASEKKKQHGIPEDRGLLNCKCMN